MMVVVAEKWDDDAPGGYRSYLKTSEGLRIELRPNRVYVVGRDASCDVRVEDPGCSRRHARLSVSGDVRVVHVQDMGSKNGTLRNGAPAKGRVQLADGDRIQIGATVYEIRLGATAADFELDTKTNLGAK
jgi:pSer/pThr/pTyr-binding forkhead associated (FHA) protein